MFEWLGAGVAPRVGAWIETFSLALISRTACGRPSRRGVDRNPFSIPARCATDGRPSRRGVDRNNIHMFEWLGAGVAPRVGAWIETFSLALISRTACGRPSRRGVDRNPFSIPARCATDGRPSRRGVDRNGGLDSDFIAGASRPSRRGVDRNCKRDRSEQQPRCRPSRRGVDRNVSSSAVVNKYKWSPLA